MAPIVTSGRDKWLRVLEVKRDGTIICFQHDREAAVNLKLLLYIFELMSGLKINFLKSEILCVGGDDELLTFYSDLFNCQIGHFPMRYL